jgi:hypothetical protein
MAPGTLLTQTFRIWLAPMSTNLHVDGALSRRKHDVDAGPLQLGTPYAAQRTDVTTTP